MPILADNKPLTGQNGLYAAAAFDKGTNELIIKLVNITDKIQTRDLVLEGVKKAGPKGKLIELKSADLKAFNTLDKPTLISPVEQTIDIKGKTLNFSANPYSLNVIRIKLL